MVSRSLALSHWFLLSGCIAALVASGPARAVDSAVVARDMERAAGGAVRSVVSPHTGAVTFLRSRAGVPTGGDARAERGQRARSFLREHGRSLALPAAEDVEVAASQAADETGLEFVRLRQSAHGIPVRFAEMTMHLRGARVTALHAKTVTDADSVDPNPSLPAADADAAARALVQRVYDAEGATISTPRLELFNRGLVEGTRGATRLAWFVAAQAERLNAWIWVDAQDGSILFHLNQLPDALHRQIYDFAYNSSTLPPGALIRSEGGPATGIQEADDVYDFTADTYNYFQIEHGRDSYDGAGAMMRATVRYCDASCGCPCGNAYWNGIRAVFGAPPFTGDDIVGHEWTHGITQYTAGLIYYKASGALNESYSDIFGEIIDLTNVGGHDPPELRWRIAETPDFTTGIRNMMNPAAFPGGDPARMSSSQFVCSEADSGGVHSNSGIGNHAFARMVDGGTYNGFTITGIGLTKAGKIEYRALSQYLTPTSGYPDNYDALLQSCADLIGIAGITAGDCEEVGKALDAVEMYAAWPCTCGNGVLDADEECDDGNQSNGDCCSSLCRVDPDGTTCSDASLCTREDACVAGSCVGVDTPRAICAAPIAAERAALMIKDKTPDSADKLAVKWAKGSAIVKSELGNPLATTDYALCLYEQPNVGDPFLRAGMNVPRGSLCGGRSCWSENSKGFKYNDRSASRGGLRSVAIAAGDAGKAKFGAKASGIHLATPPLPITGSALTVQLVNSDGLCLGATMGAPFGKNDAVLFKDKGE